MRDNGELYARYSLNIIYNTITTYHTYTTLVTYKIN